MPPKGRPSFLTAEGNAKLFDMVAAAQPDFAVSLLMVPISHALERQPSGPPAADRPATRERLAAEIARLEAEDEARVDEAVAAGVGATHRPEVLQRKAAEEVRAREEREREEQARARQDRLDREYEEVRRRQPRIGNSQMQPPSSGRDVVEDSFA